MVIGIAKLLSVRDCFRVRYNTEPLKCPCGVTARGEHFAEQRCPASSAPSRKATARNRILLCSVLLAAGCSDNGNPGAANAGSGASGARGGGAPASSGASTGSSGSGGSSASGSGGSNGGSAGCSSGSGAGGASTDDAGGNQDAGGSV